MSKKISVIVPMYNAEKSVKKCIDSIVKQTYSNLEIILVNDGSKDKTEEICNNFVKKDKRIKYFYKENSGVSETRNYGLNNASGDFIAFVDADDYLEKNMYETMLNMMDDADVIICDYFNIIDNKKNNIDEKFEDYCTFDSLEELIKSVDNKKVSRYINSPWNKLIKNELVNSKNIRFDSKISLGEDLIFNIQYMKSAKKIKIINKKLYNYIISNDGLGLKKRNIEEYMNNSIELINELIENSANSDSLLNIALNELSNVINRLANEYEKKNIYILLKTLKYDQIHNLNYKLLKRKNYIIHILLKYKMYKIIVYIYIIKNKLRK